MAKLKRHWRPAAKLTKDEVIAIDAIGRARGKLRIQRVYERHGCLSKLARVMDARYRAWRERNYSGAEPKRDSTYTVAMVFKVSPRTVSDIWNYRSWT